MTLNKLLLGFIASLLFLPSARAAYMCSELFDTQPDMSAVRNAILSTVGNERPYFLRPSMKPRFEEAEFNEKIAESYDHPTETDEGVVLFHGSIFAEGYFRMTRLGVKNPPSTTSLIDIQPWFQWDPVKKSYTKKLGHAEDILLGPNMIDHKVILYRGINSDQVAQLRALKSGHSEILNQIFTTQRDSMFFTTDEESAKRWAKGFYIEMTVNESDIEKIYTGIEYDYVEIAVPSKEVMTNSIASLKVHKYKPTGT